MPKRVGQKIKMTSIDELLCVPSVSGCDEIEVSKIRPFKDHPFKVLDDDKMYELVEMECIGAYDWTATTSIYVDKEYRRKGIGTLLYDELEKRLKEQGIVNLLAGVASCDVEDEYLTHDSSKFHICKGYTQVAHMKAVGKKFDRWYDLLWYQKRL